MGAEPLQKQPEITVQSGKAATYFKPGNPGKPVGTQNRLTRTVKEAVLDAFNELQEDENNNLAAFALKYPRDFYAIAAKLIPTDIRADVRLTQVKLEIVRTSPATQDQQTPSGSVDGIESIEAI